MKRPPQKAILVFVLALGSGYTLSWIIMTGLLGAPLRLYGFINLTLVALLIAILLVIWLDRPLDLQLFQWPAKKPGKEPEQPRQPPAAPEPTTGEVTLPEEEGFKIKISHGGLFPHEVPSEHWDADFGDGKQVYEGSALPVWLLAGWATFILWAVIYLVVGLPTAF